MQDYQEYQIEIIGHYFDGTYNWTHLYKRGHAGYQSSNIPWHYFEEDYGYMREDSSKHIYFTSSIPSGDVGDLLYDFNLEVGDTVSSTINQWAYPLVVDSIDSVLVQGNYRKRYD